MNVQKKLTKLGFKKCVPHKLELEYTSEGLVYKMVPNTHKLVNVYVNGVYKGRKYEKIKHPRNLKFYKLEHNEDTNIWIESKNDRILRIWLETIDNIKEIYSVEKSFKPDKPIKGKNDLFDSLPKNIRRDFILSDLFNF